MFLKTIMLGRASEGELGSILSSKRVHHGSQIGAPMEPKWHLKTIQKDDRFGIALKTTCPGRALHQGTGPEPRMGVGGGINHSPPPGSLDRIWICDCPCSTRPEASQARSLGGFALLVNLG